MGFLRGLLFAELNGEGDDRVRENDINHCFTHLDFEGIHEEFAELYKSISRAIDVLSLLQTNKTCLKQFNKTTACSENNFLLLFVTFKVCCRDTLKGSSMSESIELLFLELNRNTVRNN